MIPHSVLNDISIHAILNAVSDACIVSDPDGFITLWNDGAENLYGFTANDVLGKHYSILHQYTEEEKEFSRAIILNQQSSPFQREVRHRHRNRAGLLLLSSVTVLHDTEGAVRGFLYINRNISGERKSERDMLYLGTLVAQTSDAVISTDLNFVIQSWNAGAEKMYGYSSEEAIGQTTASLLRGNVTPEERKRILNEIFEKGFWKGEKIQRDKQGNSIYVLSSITLIRNSIGESIGLVGINSDVTSQNKLKAQITEFNTQLEKQVKEKTQELQTVFDRITDAFIALDENWTYTYLNEKAAELHGRSAEELIGKKIWDENPDVENEPFYELLHSAFINQKAIGQRVYSPSKKMWFENHIFPSENGVSVYYRDVTAIKKREDEKEKITDRITTILDNAFAGCIMFSHDWIYLYINRIAASYGETTPEELTGKSFLEVYPRVIETEMFRQMEKCMISRKAEHVEVPYLFKDGSTRWYELSMKPVEEGLFVLSNDITERKNAERKSLTLTEQLKEISSSLPGVVYQFAMDKDGKMKFTFVSEGMERLTGMSLEACYADAMNTFKLVDPDYLPGLYKSIEESVLSMNPWFYIFPITDLHGTKRWIRGNSVPRKSDDGGIIWNGTLIEISELKLTEAELIASESRYRSLIENASDLIFVLDENGIIREVNSKACTCLDLNEKDLVGYSLAELVFKRNNSDFSLSENKFKESNSFIENIILKQRSGAEVFVEANFNLLDDKRRLVIARDITERKKAEEAKLQTDRRYTLLFERNLAGVYRTTLAGKILDCNEAFARMMGYDSKAELLTHHTYDLYNKSEDRDKFIADLILNSVLTNYESKLKRRDGSEVYLLENVSFIKNSEFGSDIIEGIAIDMTDRVEAGEQLQVAKRRFQNLVENISGVYWVLDLYTLKILYVSPSYETITGKKCEDLCLDFHDFLNSVHPLDKPSLVWKYESEARDSKNDLEFRIIRTDGSIRWIQAKTNVIKKANGELIEYGYAEDITDSKLADEATRLSEQKYKLMFEKNPLPMWIISAENEKIIACNEAAVKQYGYSTEEFLTLRSDSLKYLRENYKTKQNNLSPYIPDLGTDIEVHQTKTGTLIYVELIFYFIEYEGKQAKLVLSNNVTEKVNADEQMKKSNEELRELSAHLQTVREEERTTIAREIHDELGQQLTGLKMDAVWLSRHLPADNEKFQEKLTGMVGLIDETVKSVRRISSNLRPGILDDLGLIDALDWASVEFEKRTGIQCRFVTHATDISFEKGVSTGIFRVYQEALTNIARHAGASKIQTTFEQHHKSLLLKIKDNGKGFDQEDILSKKTLGLVGMKERAKMIGGNLKIESMQGKGTLVSLEVPVPPQPN